ncbi:hypothetical protein D3C72_1679980 [compost metagenome]
MFRARFIFCTMAGGVPLGKASPYQSVCVYAGMPWAAKVGTFGRMGVVRVVATAISLPLCTNGARPTGLSNMMSTCPPIRSV